MTGGDRIHTTDTPRISGRNGMPDPDSAIVHRIDILTGKLSINSREIAVYPENDTVFYDLNKGDPI
jgi:hypothetical protein